ncbi:hypothetical protein MKW98_014145 [Papaver atlanticum]|uniref:RNase H type-1 domain-containing protein n=1 Tax=Papaver atlanticum TaxID=357466 RepID=A0AAD4XFI8_9MAGN|nr:hypothetical protein MKW98_014145 [Papaver atlanticum]
MQTSKPVQKLHHGEERFLKDLQFGSIDWSKLRPPASSHEIEEDSLSTTSTVEYDYTEDKYPNEDEDYKGEDGEYLTVSNNNYSLELSQISFDAIINKQLRSSYKKPLQPQTLSFFPEELAALVDDLERRRGFSYPVSPNQCAEDEWIASWKELYQPRSWTWISVYAYFNKKQGYGGYGVILRNDLAKPIIASAKFSKDGKSFFYQVFTGIKAGVQLAEKHKRSYLNVECNSAMVPALFHDAHRCSTKQCRGNYICESCEACISMYMGRDGRLVAPLLVELSGKKIVQLTTSWGTDAAGHYLAKWGKKNKRPQVEKKEERIAPDDDKPTEMKPDDFPQELKHILWQEAFRKPQFTNVRPLVEEELIW